jgi:PRA1 family protein 1
MARINIPIEVLTSRLNFGDRFSGLRSQSFGQRFANIKPIGEFLDVKRLSKPNNFAEVQTRVNYNLSYFSSNYAAVFVMLSIYGLITHPWLLFDIIFVTFGMWFIGKLQGGDLEIGTFKATTSQLYTGLLCIAVPIGFFASPFAFILWLIGASGVAIFGHASLMERPIENAFSEEAV